MSSKMPPPQDWFTKTIKVTVTKDYISDEKSEDRQEEESIDKTDLEEKSGQNSDIPVIIIISQGAELFIRENREIYNILDDLINQGLIWVHQLITPNMNDIFLALDRFRNRIAILHYIGVVAEDLQLLAADYTLDRRNFSQTLAKEQNLKLVFLNGAVTREHVKTLLEAGIPAVLATSTTISDKMAFEFAIQFYISLAQGNNIQESFIQAANYVEGRNPKGEIDVKLRRFREAIQDDSISNSPWGLYIKDENQEILKRNIYNLGISNNTEGYRVAKERIQDCIKNKDKELDLSNLGLTDLPSEFNTLSHLEVLILGQIAKEASPNQFHLFAHRLGRLPQLQSLWLNNLNLSKIPPVIFELKNLKVLRLNGNQLIDLEGINQLSNLEELWATFNQLEKIPSEIYDFKDLKKLYLGHNKITHIDEEIINLPNLLELDLEGNILKNIPDEIYNKPENILKDLQQYFLAIPDTKYVLPRDALKDLLERPLKIGSSILIGKQKSNLSAFVKKENKTFLLTIGFNSHSIGEPIYLQDQNIAELSDFISLDEKKDNLAPALIAELSEKANFNGNFLPELEGFIFAGRAVKLFPKSKSATLGSRVCVYKVSLNTGFTRGYITSEHLTMPFRESNSFYTLTDLIEIESEGQTPFSKPGDQGSLVFMEDEGNLYALGLIVGGVSKAYDKTLKKTVHRSYACSLESILQEFNVTYLES